MAIEKAFYTNGEAPVEEEALVVEVENPDSITVATDDMEIQMDFDEEAGPPDHYANLVDYMDESEVTRLGSELVGLYNADHESRHKWEESYVKGLDLLGMRFENRTTPWDGACGVFHPLLSEAVVRFQSQTIMEIFPASGPVKTTIVGALTPEKVKQAERDWETTA